MGCDIHCYAERKSEQRYLEIECNSFDWRDYSLFAFLAGVRNYSGVDPISEPRGLPGDLSDEVAEEWDDGFNYHSASWLSLEELLAFDYDQVTEDRRVTRQIAPNIRSGACTCEPVEGNTMTYREFLGEGYFEELESLKELGADRIVFWFDS